jgi:hypothetical protein
MCGVVGGVVAFIFVQQQQQQQKKIRGKSYRKLNKFLSW